MKAKTVWILAGVIFTPLALLLAVASGGMGHGDYLAARLLFPGPMLISIHLFGQITPLELVLAAAQFPVYGWLIGRSYESPNGKQWLIPIAFHALTTVLVLALPNESFS